MKKLFLIVTLIFSSVLYANPAPFELEINKTTLKDVSDKYTLIQDGINYYSEGPMYFIQNGELSIDGLKKVKLIFSKKDNILLCVYATFDKNKFDSLYKNLSKKYTLINKKLPFVGDQYAKYKNDQTTIELIAPHLSFELSLTYISNEFNKKIEEMKNQDKEQKNKKELNSL